jgi:hypothetical protein
MTIHDCGTDSHVHGQKSSNKSITLEIILKSGIKNSQSKSSDLNQVGGMNSHMTMQSHKMSHH